MRASVKPSELLMNLSQGFMLEQTNIKMNQLVSCNCGLPTYEALTQFFQKVQATSLKNGMNFREKISELHIWAKHNYSTPADSF